MAITLIDGFDLYNGTGTVTGLQAKWVQSIGGGGTQSLITGRFGGQAVRSNTGSGGSPTIFNRTLPSAVSSGTIGFACRIVNLTPVKTYIMHLRDVAGVYQIGIGVTTGGAVTAERTTAVSTGTVLGTSSTGIVSANTWHYFEVEFVISDTVGEMRVYVDGSQVLNLSAVDTRNGTPTTVQNVMLGSINGTTTSMSVDHDDLYFIDTTTRLGERKIETLRPNADTAQKDFTRSAGSDNFALVDDTTSDGDTTYVQGSTVGNLDRYTTAGLSTTPSAIDAVQLTAFALKTDATTRNIALHARSGSTDSDGSNYALAASYSKFERILETDPATSSAWTSTGVNTLQFGPKVTV
jgi:hypothetical protein